MMISPEGYYEMELKGKSAVEIAKKIRGLKNEIGHLKNTIESPDYGTEPVIHPDERTRLWCTRLYLERAIAAYEESGNTYTPSQAEKKAAAFEAVIPQIAKITFSIGGFFGGFETRTIMLTGEHLQMNVEHTLRFTPSNFHIEPDYPMAKADFLNGLRDIHIGEWKQHYNDPCVMDGTQWELTIEYADGKKIDYDGSNAYPFSFDAFRELIGSSDDDMEEEADE